MDPSRHATQRNQLESLVRQLPGFRGYLEKEYRRESDHLTRTYLAEQLQQAKQSVDTVMRRLTDAVQLDALPPLERLRARLDSFMNRLRSAERGYSGVFDYVKVGEPELEQAYQIDLSLVEGMNALIAACREKAADTNVAADALIADVQTRLDDLERKFQQRGESLKGLGK